MNFGVGRGGMFPGSAFKVGFGAAGVPASAVDKGAV